MNTLHIVSSKSDIDLCVSLLNKNDGLVILGNAVTYLLNNNLKIANIYVLQQDASMLNINPCSNVQIIDYDQMVELCCVYTKVNSWN